MAEPINKPLDNLSGAGKPLQQEPFDANEFACLMLTNGWWLT